jgi:hypothetical protein
VQSSQGFAVEQLEINPGLSETFPFLSQLAQNFECYRMHGLVFEYRATSANALNSTNTALGVVAMAVQYNCLNAPFSSKQSMEAYEGAVSSSPSQSMICGVECASGRLPLKELYVRTGPLGTTQDERFYDMGEFNIATQGMQAASDVGELWVSYDVELAFPKLVPNIGELFCHMINTGGLANNAPIGILGAYYSSATNLFINWASSTSVRFAIPQTDPTILAGFNYPQGGDYQITYTCKGTATAGVNGPIMSFGSSFTAIDLIDNGAQFTLRNVADTTTTSISVAYVRFSPDYSPSAATNNTITFATATLPTSPTLMDLIITPLNPNAN